jgi:hypothetical protein
MAPASIKLVKKFLTDNFKPLFSSNELGALGNLSSTTDDLTKKFGGLREFEITGDDLTQAFGDKVRAIDMTKENAPPFQSGYSRLVKDPLQDFTMRGQVGAIQKSPTLATDASMLQGKTLIPIVGDRTSRDVIITGIGDLEFENPVRTFGGVQFMDDPNQGWASMMDAMNAFNKKVETVEQMGGKPVGITTTMGERGGDFSLDTANVIIESLKVKKNTKKNLNQMTKVIKNQKFRIKDKVSQPFAKVPNLNDVEEFASYFRNLPGSARAELVKVFDKAELQNLGAPNIGQIRIATTNPGLLDADFLGMGARFTDLQSGVVPSKHTTYDSQIMKAPDAEVFTFGTNIPKTIMLREPMAKVRAEGKGLGAFASMPADYRKLAMNTPVQPVDQQLVDEASKYLEIQRTLGDRAAYEYAQKLIPAT